MMNTDVMRQLVAEAELGKKDMPTATAAAAFWGNDEASLHDLRYSANAIYVFRQESIPRFMRLSWTGDRNREHLLAEIDFLRYLAKQNYPAVQPIPSRQGNFVEKVVNPYATFYAVTFKAAQGSHIPIETITDVQIHDWGALLGRLHYHSSSYVPSSKYHRLGWEKVIELYATWIPEIAPNTRRYLYEALHWLAQLAVSPQHYGLIHWDFEPDNLTWHGNQIDIFDFDDAAYFWFVADIAFALDDVLDEPKMKARHIIKHFLDGYKSTHELTDDWLNKLPLFVRLMRVLKAARVYHAYSGTHPEQDPSWLEDLRNRHMREVLELECLFSQCFTAPLTPGEAEIWG